jgi:hypothetical protein
MIRTFRVDSDCHTTAGDLDRATDLTPEGGLFISQITSFGEDERGELYVLDRAGEVFKIVPTLGIMVVSGVNAQPLLAHASGDWTWEDLNDTSGHPISSYKVYRSGNPEGTFACVHEGAGNTWSGGDPETPDPGEVYHYIVTAQGGTGEETRPGSHSDGTARDVDFSSSCP